MPQLLRSWYGAYANLHEEGITTVADAGFLKGGFCYYIAREARAKNLSHAHFSLKPRPFSLALARNSLPYLTIDPFSIKDLLEHAKVRYNNGFVSYLAREGGSIWSIISTS